MEKENPTQKEVIELPDNENQEQGGQQSKKRLKLENLKLTIEKLHDCKKEDVIGRNYTRVALKDPNSFLIGTESKSIVLTKNGEEVYSGKLPGYGYLEGILYDPLLDCYFLAYKRKLYRKDLNDKPAYLYMDIECGWEEGVSFRYSNLHQRLIINKGGKKISVFNQKTRKVEDELERGVAGLITDFRLFGEQENRVVAVAKDRHVMLYNLGHDNKVGLADSTQIELLRWSTRPRSVAVCDKNKYILVELDQCHRPTRCARMLIFEVSENSLVRKACLDTYEDCIAPKWAQECLGYVGNSIVWVGLAIEYAGRAHLFAYDIDTEELRELVGKRVTHQECDPYELYRLDGKFYYTGMMGQVMRLSLGN